MYEFLVHLLLLSLPLPQFVIPLFIILYDTSRLITYLVADAGDVSIAASLPVCCVSTSFTYHCWCFIIVYRLWRSRPLLSTTHCSASPFLCVYFYFFLLMLSIIFFRLLFLATTVSSRIMVNVSYALIIITYWITFVNLKAFCLLSCLFSSSLSSIQLTDCILRTYVLKAKIITPFLFCSIVNVRQPETQDILVAQVLSHFTFILLQNCFLLPLNHISVNGNSFIVFSKLSPLSLCYSSSSTILSRTSTIL